MKVFAYLYAWTAPPPPAPRTQFSLYAYRGARSPSRARCHSTHRCLSSHSAGSMAQSHPGPGHTAGSEFGEHKVRLYIDK